MLSSLLLAWTLTIRLQRNEILDGRHSATNTRRRWRWFIRGTVFSSRDSLCSNEPRRFTGGRAAEIASFSFLFPLFSDDHFPRESSYPPFLWHVFSNTSIGKTEISAIWRRYVLFLSGEKTSFRPPFSSIAARFVNSH